MYDRSTVSAYRDVRLRVNADYVCNPNEPIELYPHVQYTVVMSMVHYSQKTRLSLAADLNVGWKFLETRVGHIRVCGLCGFMHKPRLPPRVLRSNPFPTALASHYFIVLQLPATNSPTLLTRITYLLTIYFLCCYKSVNLNRLNMGKHICDDQHFEILLGHLCAI